MLADLLAREEKQSEDTRLRHSAQLELSVNFKMCADCHAFFKGTSAFIGGQVIVREPTLTHIFDGGDCACGDRKRLRSLMNNNSFRKEKMRLLSKICRIVDKFLTKI